MADIEQVIVLAAGRANQADAMVKALIRHPVTGRSMLDHAIEAFAGKRVVVVVGFRAIEVMQAYPGLDYVINHEWAVSGNAMSLGLALNGEPTYVVSGDMFFGKSLVERLDAAPPDLVLTDPRENRSKTALHCEVTESRIVSNVYRGPVRDAAHPEAIGLFKISSVPVLRAWKRACLEQGNLIAGLTLRYDLVPVHSVDRGTDAVDEINTAADYLRLIKQGRTG